MIKKTLFLFGLISLIPHVSADLFIDKTKIRFEPENPIVQQKTRIFIEIKNTSNEDTRGVVKIYDELDATFIGQDQNFTVLRNAEAFVFADFVPNAQGVHNLSVRLMPWDENINNPNNDKVGVRILVEGDFDNDGIRDSQDTDDDNDGISDEEELENGLNPKNPDSDNDGVNDSQDLFPLDRMESKDSDQDGIGDSADMDDDNDGIEDIFDAFPYDASEQSDVDNDGIGDNSDIDDDNDGISDQDEQKKGLEPLNPDTDGDGAVDGEDVFPFDKNEWQDADQDGIGENKDFDDKNKGPVINAIVSNTKPEKREQVLFNANKSYDPEGEKLAFLWEFSDGRRITEPVFEACFRYSGKNKVKLIVSDKKGEIRTETFVFDVKPSFLEIAFVVLGGLFFACLFFALRKTSPVFNIRKLRK
ncbi:MAG: PKD domain-containing protein [Candidatus Gracilibacteria bacterium]|jgi:hypothetical protein|nr:PKD domain-containing protein [Candidatus Gracilibacteria bacterium]